MFLLSLIVSFGAALVEILGQGRFLGRYFIRLRRASRRTLVRRSLFWEIFIFKEVIKNPHYGGFDLATEVPAGRSVRPEAVAALELANPIRVGLKGQFGNLLAAF